MCIHVHIHVQPVLQARDSSSIKCAHALILHCTDTAHLSIVKAFMALATTTTETVDLIDYLLDDLCSHKEGWSTIIPTDK